MPLDEQLISHSNSQKNEADNSESDSSSTRSASLREAMRGNKSNGSLGSQGDIRADRMAALRQGGTKELAEKLKDKAAAAALSPARKGLDKLLMSAWNPINFQLTLGATLLWIDIHVFLSQIFGTKMFSKLGDEWPLSAVYTSEHHFEVKKNPLTTYEPMGCCLLNIVYFILILSALSLVAMIVSGIENPMKAIKAILGSLWCAAIGGCNKSNSKTDMIISVMNTILDTYL